MAFHSMNSGDFYFWQPITCIFFHDTPNHLLFNLIYFILFGFFIENELDRKWFSFLIITPIIFSFILVEYTWSINGFELPNIGLSNVVYGLSAFLIFLKNRNQSLFLLVLKLLAILDIVLVLWNSKNCAFSNCASVDSSDVAHLGGIIGGTICAIIYYNPFTQKKMGNL